MKCQLRRVDFIFLLLLMPLAFVNAQTYCTPNFDYQPDQHINRVRLSNLDNSSSYTGNAQGYHDYTASSANLEIGSTYTATINITRNPNWLRAALVGWIDYDNDGNFNNGSERVFSITDTNQTTRTATFPINAAATPGSYRMRIIMKTWYEVGSACQDDTNWYGETEDYTVILTAPANPLASDDNLSVVYNSTSGPNNQIDVSTNDLIGTSNGSDGDDYSILTDPFVTVNGGTVTETSDGTFNYVPATNYLGVDTFDYTLCDAGGNCTTATVFVSVGFGACIPDSNSQGTHYIERVRISGETQNINNISGDDGGYGNYLNVPAATMYAGNTYTIDVDTQGADLGWAVYIDYNQNGDFTDPGEVVYDSNGTQATPFPVQNFTIPGSEGLGKRILRVGTRRYFSSNDPCGNTGGEPEEFEDYQIDIIVNPLSGADITVRGDFTSIANNDTTTNTNNLTDFGVIDSSAGFKSHTFTILNAGGADLILGATPVSFLPGSDTAFTITAQPAAGTTVPSGGSVDFTIQFAPRSVANLSATLLLSSNDVDENPFSFLIEGEGAQIYPDTDGDGVADNVDIDDDNDGVRDTDEQNTCLTNPLSSSADVIFLNETFGSGTSRVTIDGSTPGVTTTYCYEDGTTAQGPNECDNNQNLQDGKYTVHYSITNNDSVTTIGTNGPDISTWAERVWYYGEDHTPGDTNGRMAIFNASYDPGIFYETEIVGTVAGATIDYSFWALNIDGPDSVFNAGELPRELPNITVNFYSTDKTVLYATYAAGDIERCASDPTGNCAISEWIQKSTTVVLPASNFIIQLVNNAPGGSGNDIALDDIKITQTLCDLDSDGVADVIDLDNDNDGIPNVYELGLPSGITEVDTDRDGTMLGDMNWIDVNGNGMHDLYESHTPRDSDGDGVPDYLDLDSDNDGIFDVLEYDGLGDLDVNGDGIGDGTDIDSGVNDDQNDGDGLLSLIDMNDDDGDKLDHGTAGYLPPVDTDGDGVPDYLDIDSNDASNDLSNGSDIDNSYYADQDANNDGIVDGTTDLDRDGISDGNNDYDTGLLGAPIDLERDLTIYFDGRNDYLKSSTPLTAGLSSATLMAWIIVEDNGSNSATILGEDNFEIRLRPTGHIQAKALDSNGTVFSVQTIDALPKDVWMNISVIYSSTQFTLFVNGKEIATTPTNGFALSSASGNPFTVGNSSEDGVEDYFLGFIDEIRVFNTALDTTDMRRTIYQEIEANGTYVTGKTLPRDITGITWANLIAYYDLGTIKGDIVYDSSNANDLQMFNVKKIVPQTAPIPYITSQDGSLGDNTTYIHNDVWQAQDLENYDHSIVKVMHNVTLDDSINTMGMVIDNAASIEVKDGNYLGNDWYFILNGDLDLEGDAQLLQTESSELDQTSGGKIIRRQQGEKDFFSYNYWSSPVGAINSTSNNNPFKLNMLEDENGLVQFTGIGTGTPPTTSPVTISGRWLYTFVNGVTYNDWNRVDPNTTDISAGYGWSQKGTVDTSGELEYIFKGKPNNGEILIPAIPDAGGGDTSSLLGNPYPSAIDARKFIDDNLGVIDGTIYLWDQFRGTNHQLAYYEGGYATITKLATVKAAQYDGLGALNGGAGPAIQPTFFLPVSQGFFVTVTGNGSIEFNNSQRIFKQEALNESIFLAAPGSSPAVADRSSYQDMNVKLMRLELTADSGASRQIAIGFDAGLTDGYDYGYDAYLSGGLNETDMYVPSNGDKYIIRALSDITVDKVVDIAVKGVTSKMYKISAAELNNIDATQDIWLRDNELGVYHDIKSGDYVFTLSQDGLDENRFDIVFDNPTTLSSDEFENNNVTVYYNGDSSRLFINGLESDLDNLMIYDLSGKLISRFRESELKNVNSGIIIPQVSTGIYVVSMSVNNSQKTVKLAVE